MTIYKTRYQANKDKQLDQKIIKVDGGYMLIRVSDYNIWKNQK